MSGILFSGTMYLIPRGKILKAKQIGHGSIYLVNYLTFVNNTFGRMASEEAYCCILLAM